MTNDDLLPCPFCKQRLITKPWGYTHPYDEEKPCPLDGLGWTADSKGMKRWNASARPALDSEEMVEKVAEALWRRDYPIGGSMYKAYAETPLADKEFYRNDARVTLKAIQEAS